jgi:integrase
MLNSAVEWGWLAHRPPKIRRLKEDGGRRVYLTVEQATRLREAATLDENPAVYPFVVIGLETGMRRMEILTIRKEHVDVVRGIIYIPRAKAGSREQPITKYLAAFLKSYMATLPEETPWLFPSPKSRTGHVADIRKAFRRAVMKAGLNPDQVVRHTLRHTAVTHLVQAGIDLPTVQRISGHKTLAMVAKYAHQNGDHIQAAMDKLEARYRSSAPTSTPDYTEITPAAEQV